MDGVPYCQFSSLYCHRRQNNLGALPRQFRVVPIRIVIRSCFSGLKKCVTIAAILESCHRG
jgi:hypothetical protein